MIRENFFMVKKSYVYMLVFVIIYRLLLDLMYIDYISVYYAYNKFYLNVNTIKYIISFITMLLALIIIPKNYNKPSSFILLIHYLLIIIPIMSYFSLSNQSYVYFFEIFLCFCLQCILIRLLKPLNIKELKKSKTILYLIVILISSIVYIGMLYANGISLKALNIFNVYSVRNSVKYPFGLGYLAGWQAKVINPFFIAVSYDEKKYKKCLVFLILQLILYLITGHKTYLFIPFAIIIVMKICTKKSFNIYICFVACLGILFSYILYICNITDLPCALFIRRVLFVPSQLKFLYYDFAQNYGVLNFAGTTIGKLFGINYNFDMPIANIIGLQYFGSNDLAANTGFYGTGYLYFGFIGIIFYTLVFVLVLICFDSFSKKLNVGTIIGVSLFLIVGLNDTDLLTSFMTGGMWLLLLLMYLYYSMSEFNKNKINIRN